MIYGLNEFAQGDPGLSGSVIFKEKDLRPLKDSNGIKLEGVYFEENAQQFITGSDGSLRIQMVHALYQTVMTFVVLPASQTCKLGGFIGLRMLRVKGLFGNEPSGFILSGATGNLRTVNDERVAEGLYCIYPAPDVEPLSNAATLALDLNKSQSCS